MKTTNRRHPRRHRRRGVTYVLLVGTAMIVTVIGLSALVAARVQLRSAEGTNDSAEARFYAQSAVEMGFLMIRGTSTWRNDLGSGFWLTDQPIGTGTFSLEATILDGGGDPNDDPVVLTGTGVCGQARHKMQATAVPQDGGMVIAPGSWRQVVD